MKIWLTYFMIMMSLSANCAELNKGKRHGSDRQYDSEYSIVGKKAKTEELFNFEELVEKVTIFRKELHDAPGALSHMVDLRNEIIDRFVRNSLGDRAIDEIYCDMVYMAFYSISPKSLSFNSNPYYKFFKDFIHQRFDFEKPLIAISSFIEAFKHGLASMYLEMTTDLAGEGLPWIPDNSIEVASNRDSNSSYVCKMLLQKLWAKGHHAIPLIEFLLKQDLDITSNHHEIMRYFVYAAENIELIEYVVNLWSKDPKIDLSILLDLAIEAPNVPVMQVLKTYCPDYDYSNAFHIVCDSSFDGFYGPHEKKYQAFAYLLSILDPNLLFSLNTDGYYPLAMSQGPFLKKIVLFLINNHKDLFVKLIRQNAFCSQYETEGIDFQAIDEIIEAVRAIGLDCELDFQCIDSLFRMREASDEEEQIAPGNLQAITLLICLRHQICIDKEMIADDVIDRALTLIGQIHFGGKPLVTIEAGKKTLEYLKYKYAECRDLLKRYTKTRFFPCEIIDSTSSHDISSSEEDHSYDDIADEERSEESYSYFDPFNLAFYGVDYAIGFNTFFSHKELLEMIIEKMENKSLDGFCYFLNILNEEGYSESVARSIFKYALNRGHIWSAIILCQHIPGLLTIEQLDVWQELIEHPNFCKLIKVLASTK